MDTPGNRRRVALHKDVLTARSVAERVLSLPSLGVAFEAYLSARPALATASTAMYRQVLSQHAHDWLERRLDTIGRADVETRFLEVSARAGPVAANKLAVLLGAVYRGPCVDHPGLRNPVALWRAGGGRLHPARRRTIAAPAEILPCWRRGIETVPIAVVRDMVWFGLFTGLRRAEVSGLRWEQIQGERGRFRIEENKSTRTLDLPITRQLTVILERRREAPRQKTPAAAGQWVFPGPRRREPYRHVNGWYRRISERGGAKFWFHACRNCFITVAMRDLMLPESMVKRLVNHAPSRDVTEGYAAAWTLEQLHRASQRIADRIEWLATRGSERPESEADGERR